HLTVGVRHEPQLPPAVLLIPILDAVARSRRPVSLMFSIAKTGVGRDNRRVYVSPETLTIVFTGGGLLFAIAGGFAWVVSRVVGASVAWSLNTGVGMRELRAQTGSLRHEFHNRTNSLDEKIEQHVASLREEHVRLREDHIEQGTALRVEIAELGNTLR